MFLNINLLFVIETIKEMFHIDRTILMQCLFGILFSIVMIGLFILFAHKYNKRLDNKKLKETNESKNS